MKVPKSILLASIIVSSSLSSPNVYADKPKPLETTYSPRIGPSVEFNYGSGTGIGFNKEHPNRIAIMNMKFHYNFMENVISPYMELNMFRLPNREKLFAVSGGARFTTISTNSNISMGLLLTTGTQGGDTYFGFQGAARFGGEHLYAVASMYVLGGNPNDPGQQSIGMLGIGYAY